MRRTGTPGLGRFDIGCVLVLFAVSHVTYWLLGVRFDASTLPSYMQFIDVELLRTRLFESLWYYHAHPPFLNLLAGIGLEAFGSHAGPFFSATFHAMGLVVAFCVYTLAFRMSESRITASVVTGLLVFSPAFVLYENWLMYTLPAAALLTAAALALHEYVRSRKSRWCVVFFSLLATLLLTRSLFHLAWLVLVIALLTILFWERRRQILLAATAPLLVVVFWYAKNYVLFGTFGTSTMLGLGLANISTLTVPRPALQERVDEGVLTPFALVSRYEQLDVLFHAQPHLPRTGVPVLDEIKKANGAYNFNNQRMIAINRAYTHDALAVAREFPASYVLGLIISNRLFFSPPSINPYFTEQNRKATGPLEVVFDPLLYGTSAGFYYIQQPHFGLPSQYTLRCNFSIPMVLTWWISLAYAYVVARRGVLQKRSDVDARPIVMGFVAVTGVYLYVIGTGLELAENFRYRYDLEPLLLVVMGTGIAELIRRVRAKWSSSRALTRSQVS